MKQEKQSRKTYSFSTNQIIADVIDKYFGTNCYLNRSAIFGQVIYDWIKSQEKK
jgi:hypothetical protein